MPILNLSDARERAWRRTLTGVSEKRIRVELLNRAGKPIEDLSDAHRGGTVTLNAKEDVSRAADVEVFDPKHRFGFDADTHYGDDLHLGGLIRVWWVTSGPLLDDPVECPIFTGPISRLARAGPTVSIEAQGRESLGMTGGRRTLTLKKGMRRTSALRELARVYLNDPPVKLPDLPQRLSTNVVLHPKDPAWPLMEKISGSIDGRQLYFDALGVMRLRDTPDKPQWHFTTEDDGGVQSLLSDIQTEADLQDVYNYVRVIGRTPKGKKNPVSGDAVADPSSPLSPGKIGILRNEVTNDHCRTDRECRLLAKRLLDRSLSTGRTVSYTVAAVPDLVPEDLLRVSDDYEDIRHRLMEAELPLGPTTAMSIGFTGPYRRKKPRKRRRNRR